MKCDNCGFMINPGDQKCIKCGAKINHMNVIIPGVEHYLSDNPNKSNNVKLIIFATCGFIMLAVIVFLVVKLILR